MFKGAATKFPILSEGFIDPHGPYYVAEVYLVGVGDVRQWGVWTWGNRILFEHDTEEGAREEVMRLSGGIIDGGDA